MDYEKMTALALRKICRERQLKFYISLLNKTELINLLLANDQDKDTREIEITEGLHERINKRKSYDHERNQLDDRKSQKKELLRLWKHNNKERYDRKRQEWLDRNEEKVTADGKKYYLANRDKLKKQHRDDRVKNHKKYLIYDWLRRNPIKCYEGMDALFDRYINTDNCEICGIDTNATYGYWGADKRVCDHDHNSGYARFICCQSCNVKLGKRDNQNLKLMAEMHRYFMRNF